MKVLTHKDVMELLQVSDKNAYKLLKSKDCPTFKIGNQYRILEEDLITYLKQKDAG